MAFVPKRVDDVSPFLDNDLLTNPPIPGSCDMRLQVRGPLSTQLTNENKKYKQCPLPSHGWSEEEINREEQRVRSCFMRASVDFREKLKEIPHDQLQYFIDREKGKRENREKFAKYLRVSRVGLSLHVKEVHGRHAKESQFLDEQIDIMTKEAKRMRVVLEMQLVVFNRHLKPNSWDINHVIKVKHWLTKFPRTMANLEKSREMRRREIAEQEQIRRKNNEEDLLIRQEEVRNNRLGACTSAGKRKKACESVKMVVEALGVKKRKSRTSNNRGKAGKDGIVWLSEIGARAWGVLDVANEV